MPVYEYKVRDAKGKIVSGKMEADSERDLVKKLREMNYVVTRITEERPKLSTGIGLIKMKRRDMVRFVLKLASMLQVGISLPAAIRILRDQMKKSRLRSLFDSLYRDISSGTAFSASLSCYPRVFPNIMVRMVEVGEASGNLTEILSQYAEYAENQENIRSQLKSALVYPVAVICVVIIVIYVLLTFVIPRFMSIFQKSNVALPLPTQILVNISDFARNYWLHTIAAIVVFVAGCKIAARFPGFNNLIDAIKLKIPVVSALIKKMILASFAQTLGVLYQAGVPILESLRISENIVGNRIYSRTIRKLNDHVKDGKKISEYIGDDALFNAEISEMVSVGENTGRLAEMLKKVAFFYYKEIDTEVKNLTSLFEPILICFLGFCVGFLALAIMMPIFTMMKAIS